MTEFTSSLATPSLKLLKTKEAATMYGPLGWLLS